MTPGAAEIDGAVNRLNFTKTFRGEFDALGTGILLSCGEPQTGEAGYVAIETVRGRLHGTEGEFALQQFGTMHDGTQTLHYAIVPGSGRGELTGITGALDLTVDEDGTHGYELDYQL